MEVDRPQALVALQNAVQEITAEAGSGTRGGGLSEEAAAKVCASVAALRAALAPPSTSTAADNGGGVGAIAASTLPQADAQALWTTGCEIWVRTCDDKRGGGGLMAWGHAARRLPC